ncbi:fluoride efflux transporter CrcB [Phenylobacterium sp. LjRoot225]|uniref:fluoride efflux transporter CrcB n=1 Tax=Phenylobacterium sp. LjRoot225 TaxID=3342285 RepID=UPI003ECFAB69
MLNYLFVGLGGGLGAIARYAVGSQVTRTFGTGWPYGTFVINIVGGLCMGLLIATLAHRGGADQERWRLLMGVGVLGGFTTFSAFSLEIALMIERRQLFSAALYAAGSVGLSVVALFGGMLIARRVFA